MFTFNEFLTEQDKKSNLTPDLYELVRTDEFKKWFGDWENDKANSSKILDDNGEPLVLYHGSSGNFDKFSTKYLGTSTNAKSAKLGLFFTDDKNDAVAYSRRYGGGKLFTVFLNIRNSKIKDFKNEKVNADNELVKLIRSSDDGAIAYNLRDGFVTNNQYIIKDDKNVWVISKE